jgi:hypothetical protein
MCCLREACRGNERSRALMDLVRRSPAGKGNASRLPALAIRRLLICAAAFAALLVAAAATAQPTVTISPPQVKGQDGSTTVPSVATDQAAAKRLDEERRFRINRVIVEGFRDPDTRTPRPQILEQQFAGSLNRASPELIAGKVYDGCHFDGSYFSCSDPLSSALRNLRHALR